MFGVILWSDPDVRKAVIWCEDHGDLAYYEASTCTPQGDTFFDAGDYVEFDVTEENDLRRASNAQTVYATAYPTVARTHDGPGLPTTPLPPERVRNSESAQVIPFADHLRGRNSRMRSGFSHHG